MVRVNWQERQHEPVANRVLKSVLAQRPTGTLLDRQHAILLGTIADRPLTLEAACVFEEQGVPAGAGEMGHAGLCLRDRAALRGWAHADSKSGEATSLLQEQDGGPPVLSPSSP